MSERDTSQNMLKDSKQASASLAASDGTAVDGAIIKMSRVKLKKQKPTATNTFQPTRRSGSTGSTGSVGSNGSNSSTGSGKIRPPPVRRGSHRSPPSSPSNSATRLLPSLTPQHDFETGCKYRTGSDGYKADMSMAFDYIKRSADKGYGLAQCALGIMYEYGAGVNHDIMKAEKWYGLAAEQGECEASFKLACLLLNRRGDDLDDEFEMEAYAKAIDLLANAAGRSHAEAQVKLGCLITCESVSDHVKLLAIKATVHVTESLLHSTSSSTPPTYITVDSARANDKLMSRLLSIDDDDVTLEYSLTVGKLLLRLAFKQGSLSAHYELGRLLITGRFNPTMKRDMKSFGIEVKEVGAEFTNACRRKGRDLWVQAAEQGHTISQHALFDLFSSEYGATVIGGMDDHAFEFNLLVSKEDARNYLMRAVEAELPIALEQYGMLLLEGDTLELGFKKDQVKAIECLTIAAHNGCGLAQQRMGDIYRLGTGVKKDSSTAIEWYTRASLLGVSSARVQLAKLLLELNGPHDVYAAGFHLKAAVAQGNIEAILELADYELKTDEKQGLPRARALLESASLQGSSEAGRRLKGLRDQSRRASEGGLTRVKSDTQIMMRSSSSQQLKVKSKKGREDVYEMFREAESVAEELCKDHTAEKLAEERERERIWEEKMFFDDGIGREMKKLAEFTIKVKRETDRKAHQLNKVYDAALEKKYVKRRKKDRSVRTVEGYSDDWFNTQEAHSQDVSRHLLSAGERISAKMGKKIQAKDNTEFSEFSFDVGLQVWRAEGFNMVLDPQVSNAVLNQGASYIIVHNTDDVEGKSGIGGLKIHLFHWVGSAASLDSKTVSSFKCTELARRLRRDMAESLEDDRISAKTVRMTRESQGEESEEFLRAFQSQNGLQYLEGVPTTALQRPPPKHDRPRLFRVTLLTSQVDSQSQTPKGGTPKALVLGEEAGAGRLGGTPKHKKAQTKPRVEASLCEVERRETSLKAEWVLILDGGKDIIFVFRGFLSNTLHRAKAFEMAFLMRQERIAFIGKCRVVQVDQGEEPDEFWQLMPEVEMKPEVVAAIEDGTEDCTDEGFDDDMFEDIPKRGRRKSIYLKKISQWELSISLALDQVVDQVVEEMFTSSSERILHSFYRQKHILANESTHESLAIEVDVFDYDASFFTEDKSMGLTIKDVLIMSGKDKEESKVQVVAVDAGSPGDLEGIEAGDILLAINNSSLDNLRRKAVTEKIKSAGRPLTITLRRGFPLVDDASNHNSDSRRKTPPPVPVQDDVNAVDEEEEERVRDFTSLLIENGQRPSVSVLNQFRSVIGGSFKPWKKKKNMVGMNENRIDEDLGTIGEDPSPSNIVVEEVEKTKEIEGPAVLGSTASERAFSKYQEVETAVGLRPGASVLVQRSSGEWCFGEVLTYDFNTSVLSVRVGAMKKKALELNKKKHLTQLRVRPGDILLGTAPDSPEAGGMRKRPSSDKLAASSQDKSSTPRASKGGTPRASGSRGGTPRALGTRSGGGGVSRLDGGAFNFQEDDTLEMENEFRQRRILYRVGIIGGQYNIAEVYSRSEGYGRGGSDHSEQVKRSALKSEGVFILDCNTEVYVWLGRKATSGIRLAGVQVAQRLVVMDELRPKWVELSQVQEGAEPFVFRTKFLDWFSINAQVTAKSMIASKHENLKSTGQLHAVTAQQAARQRSELKLKLENRTESEMKQEEEQRDTRIDNTVEQMITVSQGVGVVDLVSDDMLDKTLADQLAQDDGCGMTIMWRLTSTALLQVDEVEHGHFKDNCIYVILYGFVAHSGDTDDEDDEEAELDEVDEQLAELEEHDDPMVVLSAAVKRRGLRLEMGGVSKQKGSPRFVLYVWVGERAPRTLLARWKMEVSTPWLEDWQEELGQTPKEIRIQQRLEPNHFLNVFSNSMVVHVEFAVKPIPGKGRMLKDAAFSPISPKSLFHIKGRPDGDESTLHAIQTKLTDDLQLCSSDVYLLHLYVTPEVNPDTPTTVITEPVTSEGGEDKPEEALAEGATLGPVSKLWIWVGWRCAMEVREVASEIAARVSDYFDVEASHVNIAGETAPVYDSDKFVVAPQECRSLEEIAFWKDIDLTAPWPVLEKTEDTVTLQPKPRKSIWRTPRTVKSINQAAPSPSPPPSVEAISLPIPTMKELTPLYLGLTPNEEAYRDGGQVKQHIDGFQFSVEKRNVWCQHALKRDKILLVCGHDRMYLWIGSEVLDSAGQVQDALKCSQAFLDHLRKSKIEESSESKEGTEETLGVSLNEVSIVAHEVSLVRQRDEPPSFKHLFHAWCPWEQFDRDTFLDPRAARLHGLKKSGEGLIVGRVVNTPPPPPTEEKVSENERNVSPPPTSTTPSPMSSTPIPSDDAISPIAISPRGKAATNKASKKFIEMLRGVRGRQSDSKTEEVPSRRASESSVNKSSSVLTSSMSAQEMTELTSLLGRRSSLTNVETLRVQALMKQKIALPNSIATPSVPTTPSEAKTCSLSIDELNELTSLMGSRTPLTNVQTQRVQVLMRQKSAYQKNVTASSPNSLASPRFSSEISSTSSFPQEKESSRRRASEPFPDPSQRPKVRMNNRELSPPPMSRGRPADATVRAAAANARTVNHARTAKNTNKKGKSQSLSQGQGGATPQN